MRIDRDDLQERLVKFSLSGHGVVTGAPGVGKTVAVSQLAKRFLDEERGVYMTDVDELNAINPELAPAPAGNWINTLRMYFDTRETPGAVVVDGFDAARNPVIRHRVVRMIEQLIVLSAGRWHVLVTVRQYDATKSPDLMSLFPADDRAGTRVFEIPLLTWVELDQVQSTIEGLSDVIEHASPSFRDLLRLPFNLWLVEQILRTSREEAIGKLSQVETEVQLLDQFWRFHVSEGRNGPARASVVKRAASIMVASQRLSISVNDVWSSDFAEAWNELLSAEILALAAPAASRVTFGHNILFDYAAGIYVLSTDPNELQRFLSNVPARALFLRPSLIFLFSHLWNHNRRQFWQLFKGLSGATELAVRLVVRLIPTYVLASGARSIADLRPLGGKGWHDNGHAYQWTLQAARFAEKVRMGVWSTFVARLMKNPDSAYAWDAALLLRKMLVDSNDIPDAKERKFIRTRIADGAQRLLTYALQRRDDPGSIGKWWEDLGSRQALPLVIGTMDVRLHEAVALIREVVALLYEPESPIWFFFVLSEHIRTIARLDPRLAADIYTAVFSYEETSDSPTPIGGVIIRLQSTRRQDYEGVQYGLIEAYEDFVALAPIEAIGAGLRAGCSNLLKDGFLRFVAPSEVGDAISRRTRPIHLLGATGQWLEDQSALSQRYGHQDGVRLITAAAHGILSLARKGDVRLQVALREYVRNASISLAVAKLLRVGASAPDVLSSHLRELAIQRPIQMSMDLRKDLAGFIRAAAPHWTIDDRREVEESILGALVKEESDVSDDQRSHAVDALIAAIPSAWLVTTQGRERAANIASNDIPPNTDQVRPETQFSEYTQDDWLLDRGVDPERPANRVVRLGVEALKTFNDQWQNKPPTAEAVDGIEAPLERAMEALATVGADDLVLREGWTVVAATAATIARMHSLGPTNSRWNSMRSLLLSALNAYPHSVEDNADASYTWPHWSPSPQTEAIQGLATLLWKSNDPIVVAHFEEVLLNERDPALRFLAAHSMSAIFRSSQDRFWTLAHTIAANERNVVVMTAFLGILTQLVWKNGDQVRHVVQLVWPRWKDNTHKDLVRTLGRLLLVLATHNEDAWAIDVMREICTNALEYNELLNDVLFDASVALAPSNELPSHRPRVERLRDLLTSTLGALKRIDIALAERQDTHDVAAGRGRVHQMVDTIATRLSVNLRLGDLVAKAEDAESLNADVDSYYKLIWPVVEAILDFAEGVGVLMARTAHHLLQLFNILIAVDPDTVVVAANRAVQAARSDGYNLDSLAIRQVVQLVETVLADEREVLFNESSMYALLELLDTFVEVGWAEASELIWRLDEAFR